MHKMKKILIVDDEPEELIKIINKITTRQPNLKGDQGAFNTLDKVMYGARDYYY